MKQKLNIDKQLKFRGNVVKTFMTKYKLGQLKFYSKIVNLLYKGKAKTKKFNYRQEYINRQDGSKLRICIYTPKQPKTNMVGLLWMHGGGYAVGSPEVDIGFYKEFMSVSDCVIVAPDYTLSIKKPYPSALEDCYLALTWLKDNTTNLNINDSQIFIGGDSAGGGLCAALSLYARDKAEINIAFQMPIYPMIDCRETSTSKNNVAPVWNTKNNKMAWQLYLGKLWGTENVPKYASPSLETDYSNLPTTLTYVGDLEPFLDETKTYVENLKKAGVKVLFEIYNGCYHGFDIVCLKAKVSQKARKFLRDGFVYATQNCFKNKEEIKHKSDDKESENSKIISNKIIEKFKNKEKLNFYEFLVVLNEGIELQFCYNNLKYSIIKFGSEVKLFDFGNKKLTNYKSLEDFENSAIINGENLKIIWGNVTDLDYAD